MVSGAVVGNRRAGRVTLGPQVANLPHNLTLRACHEITLPFQRGARTRACRGALWAGHSCRRLVFHAGARVEKPGTGPQSGNLDTARTSACATPAARTWHGYFVTNPKRRLRAEAQPPDRCAGYQDRALRYRIAMVVVFEVEASPIFTMTGTAFPLGALSGTRKLS